MREIKYRAWLTLSDYDDDGNDKDYHGMATSLSVHHGGDIGFSVEDGHQTFDGDIFERALDNGTVAEYEGWCLWEGPFELMQYTGLKDKNGVEIYEGDIVDDHYFKNNISRHKVYWADSYGCWSTINLKDPVIDRKQLGSFNEAKNLHRNEYLEVIGNIYENPELVKAAT